MALAERRPEPLLSWMGGLADPTRLRLLRVLERHEVGVVELCDALQLPQSTVSRHLKVLADQGWVGSRAQGTTRRYRMADLERDSPARRLWLLAREQMNGWATLRQDELRLARRLEARRPAAQAFFAGAAGRWDRLRRELYGDGFTQAALLSLLPSQWVVADLGCGTGRTAAALAPHVRRVIGVDQSEAMLKAARRRIGERSNVELRRGSLEALPLEDASINGALLLLTLTYVPDPSQALREAARVLAPGGRLAVVDLLRHDREEFRRQMGQVSLGFEPEELRGLIERAGFAGAGSAPLPPAPAAKGPALVLASAAKPETVVAFRGTRDARTNRTTRNARTRGRGNR